MSIDWDFVGYKGINTGLETAFRPSLFYANDEVQAKFINVCGGFGVYIIYHKIYFYNAVFGKLFYNKHYV